MKKRILPALLALCMVMSLLPTAFAGTTPACENESCTNASCTEACKGKCSGTCTDEAPCNGCKGEGGCAYEEPEEEEDDGDAVVYCGCDYEGHQPWLDAEGEKHTGCSNTVENEGYLCAACEKNATHNPCSQ